MADDNTAVGANALGSLPSGTQNVAVGSQAGKNLTSGGQNVIIGYNGGPTLASGSGNIIIGAGADVLNGANSSNSLNIGGAITGDLSSGAISLSASPPPWDNSTRIATTAYVNSFSGPFQLLYRNSINTTTNNLINMCSVSGSVGNYPVPNDTYTQLELRIYNLQANGNAGLTVSFMNKGNANTGSNYLSIGGASFSQAGTPNETPGGVAFINNGNWTDGSGVIVLHGFCFSDTTVTPSIWFEMCVQDTGAAAGYTTAALQNGMIACNQLAGQTFDGLQFSSGGGVTYTFDFELYGIV